MPSTIKLHCFKKLFSKNNMQNITINGFRQEIINGFKMKVSGFTFSILIKK